MCASESAAARVSFRRNSTLNEVQDTLEEIIVSFNESEENHSAAHPLRERKKILKGQAGTRDTVGQGESDCTSRVKKNHTQSIIYDLMIQQLGPALHISFDTRWVRRRAREHLNLLLMESRKGKQEP